MKLAKALSSADFPPADDRATGKTTSADSVLTERIEQISPLHLYPPTVELFRQGTLANDVYFLVSGLIKLVRTEEDGRQVIVDLRFPGSLTGDFASILHEPYPVTAITLMNSHVRRVPAESFRQLVQDDLDFSWQLHQLHSRIAFEHVLRIEHLTFFTARQRLEELLRQLVILQAPERSATDIWLNVPLKYWEIAELIVVSPAYLSRLFKELEKDGLVLRKKGRLIIRNEQKRWLCLT